jgi:hypothetical protein
MGSECTVLAVRLVERWNGIESDLDPRWTEVALSLAVHDEEPRRRAAALLGPAGPGLAGSEIRFDISTRGHGIGPEAARRLLRRIDEEGIVGRLELVASRGARPAPEPPARSLETEWHGALAGLPSDWSDLVAELELDSSADVDRGAVLCAPLNPIQPAGGTGFGFRFRCANARGYGASVGMAARCLARLDEAGITGHVRVTAALSDVHPVGTQGATFAVGRRPV